MYSGYRGYACPRRFKQDLHGLEISVPRGGVKRRERHGLVDRGLGRFEDVHTRTELNQPLDDLTRRADRGLDDQRAPHASRLQRLRLLAQKPREVVAAAERSSGRDRQRRAGLDQRLCHLVLTRKGGFVER